MKAVVWTKYGPPDGLQLQEVEKPVPAEDEVLIKVFASTVSAGDCELRSLKLPVFIQLPLRIFIGLYRPTRIRILGQELAGEIEATGQSVTRFKIGDPVYAWTAFRLGGYAEYACLRETAVMAIKPANLSYPQAAAIPLGGPEALHFLRRAKIRSGEKVLIVGACGAIGTIAVQLAKYYDAEVTGVDSTGKLDTLRAIGADHVIDYTRADFTRNGQSYDVILDTVGKSPLSRSIRSLKPGGRFLSNPRLSGKILGRLIAGNSNKTILFETANARAEDLVFLKELIEAGKIQPVIDRIYPLEQTAEAHRYVETGQKKGNVVIAVRNLSSGQPVGSDFYRGGM